MSSKLTINHLILAAEYLERRDKGKKTFFKKKKIVQTF